MAAASASSQNLSQRNPENVDDSMLVDQAEREKRKAETTPVAVESDDDDALQGTPLQNPNPPAAMTVEQLLRYSIDQNEKHFKKLDRDMSKLQREGSETRKMAARAVTSAEDTKNRVDRIEKRLTQLETQTRNPAPVPKKDTSPSRPQGRTDWQELGGEDGDTLVLGGFRAHSTADERRTELDDILALFPPDLTDKTATRIIPEPRTNVVLLKVHHSDQGTAETRRNMLAWCKQVRALKLKRQVNDEPAREIYASPSKPFHMRQRDAKTFSLFQTLKALFQEDQQEHVTFEIGTGRVFYHNYLIANRPRGTSTMQPCLPELQKHIPDLTQQKIDAKQLEVEKERERSRAEQ